jgi:hypothetical protein
MVNILNSTDLMKKITAETQGAEHHDIIHI